MDRLDNARNAIIADNLANDTSLRHIHGATQGATRTATLGVFTHPVSRSPHAPVSSQAKPRPVARVRARTFLAGNAAGSLHRAITARWHTHRESIPGITIHSLTDALTDPRRHPLRGMPCASNPSGARTPASQPTRSPRRPGANGCPGHVDRSEHAAPRPSDPTRPAFTAVDGHCAPLDTPTVGRGSSATPLRCSVNDV